MGNKSVLMSIQPKWVAKILNGEKTIEVRKKFPKDYVGWVYIYCTKGKRNGDNWLRVYPFCLDRNIYQVQDDNFNALNGKVVARFWCDKVEEINGYNILDTLYETANLKEEELLKLSCLTYHELNAYLKYKVGSNVIDISKGYAIHITDVKMFDEPKELRDFMKCCDEFKDCLNCKNYTDNKNIPECRRITRVPQSWCYIYDKGQYV